MSKPAIIADKTTAGIAVDPRTLERVIPESKRPDGSVRKQIKIRPGFTPQEDVRRFRGTKQTQMDASALPKGHIIGWAPPPTSTAAADKGGPALSKAAKKNAKRKEKRKEKREQEEVKDNWEDDDEEESGGGSGSKTVEKTSDATATKKSSTPSTGAHTPEKPNWAVAPNPKADVTNAPSTTGSADALAGELEHLEVR